MARVAADLKGKTESRPIKKKGACLKCQSSAHAEFKCPESLRTAAQELWEKFKRDRFGRASRTTSKATGIATMMWPEAEVELLEIALGSCNGITRYVAYTHACKEA
jgi:hypothetical protein